MKKARTERLALLRLGMVSIVWLAGNTYGQPESSVALRQVVEPAPIRGWVAAEGGGMGGCEGWTEEYFGWMVERAKGVAAGGKVRAVVLGAVPLDEPDERLKVLEDLGAEATGLVVDQSNADSVGVAEALAAADLIFIRGGDQSRYVNWWRGTLTESAIRGVFERGGVIGGTSAGCAILGEVSFDARIDSLSSVEALTDARHPNITITRDFLGLVPGVMFDSHFGERSRLARGAVLLAHANEQSGPGDPLAVWRRDRGKKPIRLMGVDPCTAVMVASDGSVSIMGRGRVTTLLQSGETTVSLEAGKPPMVGPLVYSAQDAAARGDFTGVHRGTPPEAVSILATTWDRKGSAELETFLTEGGAKGDLRVVGMHPMTATLEGSMVRLGSENPAPVSALVIDVGGFGVPGYPHGTGRLWVVPVSGKLDLKH